MTLRALALVPAAALTVVPPERAAAGDSPLALSDLAAYRKALIAGPAQPPAQAVGYRALWEHPQAYEGKRVQVEGRIVRRFRQGAVGTFPALIEAWAVTPAGEPSCWIFPDAAGPAPAGAATVRFVGTFLRRIRYEGADVPRLAPLIVGPSAPSAAPSPPPAPRAGFSPVDWALGVAAALTVALVLFWQHARRPPARFQPGPAPSFEDGTSPGNDASGDLA